MAKYEMKIKHRHPLDTCEPGIAITETQMERVTHLLSEYFPAFVLLGYTYNGTPIRMLGVNSPLESKAVRRMARSVLYGLKAESNPEHSKEITNVVSEHLTCFAVFGITYEGESSTILKADSELEKLGLFEFVGEEVNGENDAFDDMSEEDADTETDD